MKSVMLENSNPIINSYWFWADQFVIINGVINSKNWMINNFIDLMCYKKMLPGGIYFSGNGYRNKMVEFYDCPFIEMQKIAFDENKKIFGYEIIEFVKKSIDYGNFVLLMVDRMFISEYGFKHSNYHEILIHGYDDGIKKFIFCDNDKNGKFKTNLICTYSELENSYMAFKYFKDEPDFNTSVFLFRPREDNSYSINIQKIKKNITQYLKPEMYDTSDEVRGNKIHEELIEYFHKSILTGKIELDVRGISALYDHKKAMLFRLNELKDFVQISNDYIEQYSEIVEKCRIILNLFLKYTIVKDNHILIKCINYLKEIHSDEINVLGEFITKI